MWPDEACIVLCPSYQQQLVCTSVLFMLRSNREIGELASRPGKETWLRRKERLTCFALSLASCLVWLFLMLATGVGKAAYSSAGLCHALNTPVVPAYSRAGTHASWFGEKDQLCKHPLLVVQQAHLM